MDKSAYVCQKCAGPKNLFFERRPRAVLIAVLFALGALAGVVFFPVDAVWRGPVIYAGLVLAVLWVLLLLRIRCLACEPEWKERIWGR